MLEIEDESQYTPFYSNWFDFDCLRANILNGMVLEEYTVGGNSRKNLH